MSEAINYEDPATWPTDLDALEALANGKSMEDDEVPKPEAELEPEPEPEPAQAIDQEKEPNETAVLAKDGKHLIPYKVVEDQRETIKQLTKALELANQGRQDGLKEDGGAGQQPPQDIPIWLQPQAVQDEYIADLREEYGDKIAEQEIRLMRMERNEYDRHLKDEQAVQHAQAEKRSAMQAAIDKNPLVKAWQDDEKPEWYDKANSMFKFLAEHDAAFAKLPMDEKIQRIAERTEALFGTSPHSEALKPAKPQTKNQEPPSKFPIRTPISMSELPGGTQTARDKVDQYENMSGAALTRHFNNMTPKQLAQALAEFGI